MHIRARKVITRGPVRCVGKFPSRKNGRMVHWESQLERDRFYQLEMDARVLSFREQPNTYEFEVDGNPRSYTPDLEVHFIDHIVIEEVKPSDRLAQYEDIFKAFEFMMAVEGIAFRVVTEKDIRIEPALSNLKYLYRYSRGEIDQDLAWKVVRALQAKSPLSFADFRKAVGFYTEEADFPFALLAKGYASIPLHEKFTDKTLVTIKEKEDASSSS